MEIPRCRKCGKLLTNADEIRSGECLYCDVPRDRQRADSFDRTEMPDSAPNSVIIPGGIRAIDFLVRTFCAAIFAWGTMCALITAMISPRKPSDEILLGSMVVAAFLGLCYALWRYYFEYFMVKVSGETIELYQKVGVDKIHTASVYAFLGLEGISFDFFTNGEYLVWDKLWIVTPRDSHLLKLGAELNPVCYKMLKKSCSRAMGFPAKQDIDLPSSGENMNLRKKSLLRTGEILFHHILKAMSISIILVVLAVGNLLYPLFSRDFQSLFQNIDNCVWLLVGAFFFAILNWRKIQIYRTIQSLTLSEKN